MKYTITYIDDRTRTVTEEEALKENGLMQRNHKNAQEFLNIVKQNPGQHRLSPFSYIQVSEED